MAVFVEDRAPPRVGAHGLFRLSNRYSDALFVDFQAMLEQQILDVDSAVVVLEPLLFRKAVLQVRANMITIGVIDLGQQGRQQRGQALTLASGPPIAG